ncbi:glycosyltransferase [Paenisporosarcina indica]|uniref:glycosyltransferase n=1 Tax=Paenisporosarcina indica TaxID=650093 RepID=UPI00094F4E0C|nr:glycosyltransferase [Paenisporosarcina indica]
MRITIVSEQRFFVDKNNNYYTTAPDFFDKIADLYGEKLTILNLVGRVVYTDNIEQLFKIGINSKLNYYSIDNFNGIKDFMKKLINISLSLQKIIFKSDVVILKLPFLTSIPAFVFCKIYRKIIVSQIVGDPQETLNSISGNKKVGKLAFLVMKFIIINSDIRFAVSSYLSKKYGSKNKKIKISNESSLLQEHFSPPVMKQILSPIKILFVGRISKEKGINLLIEAFNIVKEKYDLNLTIIGDGPQITELKELCIKLNIMNLIEFKGKIAYGDTLLKEYREADIFVLPSYSEGLGKVVLEAMANSTNVIASNVGGLPDIVRNNETGLLFKVGQVNDLVEKIEYYLENPKEMQKMKEIAYKFVKENHSFNNQRMIMSKAIISYYSNKKNF